MGIQENTTNNTPSTVTSVKGGKRRRKASHDVVRRTETTVHFLCGDSVSIENAKYVKVDKNHTPISTEYYECPGCRAMRNLEEEMRGAWPKFTVDATLALDIADITKPKD